MNDNNRTNYVPEYDNDALSEALYLLNLDVNIYHNAKVCGNWNIHEHKLGATCFHIVTHGSCALSVPEFYEGILQCGDLVIFPKEISHSMYPEKKQTGAQQHLVFQGNENIEGTGLLCGEVCFRHEGFRYLFAALPPLFIIKYDDATPWLQSLLKMLVAENHKMGMASKVIFDKLAELLFIYALRQYLLDHPVDVGVLSIYVHPRIAKAVSAIHKHPEYDWTLELMAKEAILSRSTFATTFKKISGWTAGQYLAWWRMQVAWSLLEHGESITQVSTKVGYHSESSFSRAFQKLFGISAGKVKNLSRSLS